jgi:ATP-dependent helicase/DNAse subunit B
VIDYKTGSTSSTEQDIKAGRNMQLPVYALAVNESVMSDGRAEDGCFLSIRASKRIAGFDFDKNKELLEITKKNIVNFVEQIRVGNYIVKPSNSTLCKTCEYSTACRISEIRQGEADDTVD